MSYAFSKDSLEQWANTSLEGEFQYLRETLLNLPAQRAERACIELAFFLRYLDDEEGISALYEEQGSFTFGLLKKSNGKKEAIDLRQVANKIIHSRSFDWDFSNKNKPKLICKPREEDRWKEAIIDITSVAVVCGNRSR